MEISKIILNGEEYLIKDSELKKEVQAIKAQLGWGEYE